MDFAMNRRNFVKAASLASVASLAAGATAAFADEAPAVTPKYIFLFIGDGMGNEQVQIASFFKGATENDGAVVQSPLTFMGFPHVGSVTTYDSTSFCPDSASTATSIATGNKTKSGTINMDPETLTQPFETISEKLHSQKGYKVGVLSTVNMNHATPAAFYAHQDSRKNYYAIGQEMTESGFEFFAGGAWLAPTDKDEDKTDLNELAAQAGYTVVTTQTDAQALGADSGNVLIIAEALADGDAMNYELDAAEGEWRFADYVKKGIECLGDEQPFFMMAEGGKIDWACHANDAASSIHDTMALADAVQVAVDFAKEHADETLILVTGDHETGGLTIGFAGTDYDTYLNLLESQKISFAKFDSDYVAKYKENKTSFDEVMADVTELFGLKTSGEEGDKLVLTDYELSLLKTAYEKSINEKDTGMDEQQEYVLYGTYEPLTVTITHIINNKSGVSFTSYSHTGLPVAVLAQGVGSDVFNGYYDNTDIYNKLAEMLSIA